MLLKLVSSHQQRSITERRRWNTVRAVNATSWAHWMLNVLYHFVWSATDGSMPRYQYLLCYKESLNRSHSSVSHQTTASNEIRTRTGTLHWIFKSNAVPTLPSYTSRVRERVWVTECVLTFSFILGSAMDIPQSVHETDFSCCIICWLRCLADCQPGVIGGAGWRYGLSITLMVYVNLSEKDDICLLITI